MTSDVRYRHSARRSPTDQADTPPTPSTTSLVATTDVAEPDSLVLPFLNTKSGGLLSQHASHRTAHAGFVAEILDVLADYPSGLTAKPTRQPFDALSDAETRVLRFLPTNLTAAAIGHELHVTTNTVKTHMQHIYTNLGAHSREAAVHEGRRFGLLGGGRHG